MFIRLATKIYSQFRSVPGIVRIAVVEVGYCIVAMNKREQVNEIQRTTTRNQLHFDRGDTATPSGLKIMKHIFNMRVMVVVE